MFDDEEWLLSQKYYHGTSTSIKILDSILRPSEETGIIREQCLTKVYITTSKISAKRYAYKAVNKFGGDAIIYEVEPDIDSLMHRIDNEFICDFAKIISQS